jgi:hypothetical protein
MRSLISFAIRTPLHHHQQCHHTEHTLHSTPSTAWSASPTVSLPLLEDSAPLSRISVWSIQAMLQRLRGSNQNRSQKLQIYVDVDHPDFFGFGSSCLNLYFVLPRPEYYFTAVSTLLAGSSCSRHRLLLEVDFCHSSSLSLDNETNQASRHCTMWHPPLPSPGGPISNQMMRAAILTSVEFVAVSSSVPLSFHLTLPPCFSLDRFLQPPAIRQSSE